MRRALLIGSVAVFVFLPTSLKLDGFMKRDGFLPLKLDGFYVECPITITISIEGTEIINCAEK